MPSSVSARRRATRRERTEGCARIGASRTGFAHRVTVRSFESRSLPSGPVAAIGRGARASAAGAATSTIPAHSATATRVTATP